MDAYHAPYKKETRFWTGLILLVRCIFFLVSALNTIGNDKLSLLVITSVTAVLATLAWVHHRVYEKLHNDLLEASFVLNLCILVAGTYITYRILEVARLCLLTLLLGLPSHFLCVS